MNPNGINQHGVFTPGVFTLAFSSEPAQQPCKLVSFALLAYSKAQGWMQRQASCPGPGPTLDKGPDCRACQGTQLVGFFPRLGVSRRAEEELGMLLTAVCVISTSPSLLIACLAC